VFRFEEIGKAHHEMEEGAGSYGNRVALVGAPERGQGRHWPRTMTRLTGCNRSRS